jgi:hypothetical protein
VTARTLDSAVDKVFKYCVVAAIAGYNARDTVINYSSLTAGNGYTNSYGVMGDFIVKSVYCNVSARRVFSPLPFIEILSPIPAPDVHSTASIPLQVRVNIPTDEADITLIRYSLDGSANNTITDLAKEAGRYYWTNTEGVFVQGNAFSTESTLNNLAEGNHTLIIYSHNADNTEMAETREFTIDFNYVPPYVPSTSSPAMTIVSPLPVTYANSSIPLNFGANVWLGAPEIISLSYSIDGNANVTITDIGKTGIQNFGSQAGYNYHDKGGLTLNDLSNGNHTLWVYSLDAIGNEMSWSVQFTVDATNETATEAVPYYSWFLAPLIIGLILGVSISVLHYRRHRKTANLKP